MDDEQVMVVAAARAENVARKYRYYVCQNGRSFRPSKYIAFYKDGHIQYAAKILGLPTDDNNLLNIPEFQAYIKEVESDYEVGGKRKLYKLGKPFGVGPITNNTVDKNGDPCPFTYGQPRYTTLDHLKKAKWTSEL